MKPRKDNADRIRPFLDSIERSIEAARRKQRKLTTQRPSLGTSEPVVDVSPDPCNWTHFVRPRTDLLQAASSGDLPERPEVGCRSEWIHLEGLGNQEVRDSTVQFHVTWVLVGHIPASEGHPYGRAVFQ